MADVGREYAQQLDAARLAVARGDLSAAEALLTEALAIGERQLGAEHPSLGVALNELSRVYIRQSAHARAEMVLNRLLQITRAKGEQHPDVATVLAGIAVAKRGLGDEAGAQQLLRQALRIREQVLEPNHMAIVVTLEQLSETCAARGNFVEAMSLLRRALPIRERALGGEHATVIALRSRISDLERRHAYATATADAPAAAATPASPPARDSKPSELVFIYEPEKPARRSMPLPRERAATPAYSAAVAAASLMAAPAHAAPPAPPVAAPPVAAPAITPPPAATDEWVIPASAKAIVEAPSKTAHGAPAAVHHEITPEPKRIAEKKSRSFAEPARRSKSDRRVLFGSAGLAVLVFAIGGYVVTSRGADVPGNHGAPSDDTPRVVAMPAATPIAQPALGAAAVTAAARFDSTARHGVRTTSAATIVAATAAKVSANASASPAPQAPPSAPGALPDVAALALPTVAMTNVDSMERLTTKNVHDSSSEPIVHAAALRTQAMGDDATATQPLLIGAAPTPRFPDELRATRTEGEVVVQFRVDEKGRVDPASMKVVQSPHELFTSAVRAILPRFRFDPARSAAPESKPESAWVQYRIQFTAGR